MSVVIEVQDPHRSGLDVSLELPGMVTALYGPSGSGKTTLLRAVAGLEQFPNSVVRIGGEVWQDKSIFVPPHRRSAGFVFQEARLFAHLHVLGNLKFGASRTPAAERRLAMDRVVDSLDLRSLLHRKPSTLSGGEQQRVAIGRALAMSPRVLLMDEPLASLDASLKEEVLSCLEAVFMELKIPVIYVTHEQGEVARLADHMVLLEGGRVSAQGPADDVFTRLDAPLAHAQGARSLIPAVIDTVDERFDLTVFKFAGGRISAPGRLGKPGSRLRLQIFAKDVSLTLNRQTETSILNIFPAVIQEMRSTGTAQTTVLLKAGDTRLLSRLTNRSASLLGLRPGLEVFAQAKSAALAE